MRKLIPILLLLTACNTEKRVNDWSVKNPDKFRSLAAIIAPCVDVNPKSDTIYRSKIDTLITAGRTDTVRRNDTVFITKQLPGRTIVQVDVQTVTKTVADSRMLDACAIKSRGIEEELIRTQSELSATKTNRDNWRTAFFILVGLVIGWFFLSKYIGAAFGWIGSV